VSADSRLVVVADDDGLVRLHNYPCVVQHSPCHEHIAHGGHVACARFLGGPGDMRVISVGGGDRATLQWRLVPAPAVQRRMDAVKARRAGAGVLVAAPEAAEVNTDTLLPCPICGRTFSADDNLRKHTKHCRNAPMPGVGERTKAGTATRRSELVSLARPRVRRRPEPHRITALDDRGRRQAAGTTTQILPAAESDGSIASCYATLRALATGAPGGGHARPGEAIETKSAATGVSLSDAELIALGL